MDSELTQQTGVEGLVYYIEPIDSTLRTEYSAGFYIADFPKEFVTTDTCKGENFQGLLLGNMPC